MTASPILRRLASEEVEAPPRSVVEVGDVFRTLVLEDSADSTVAVELQRQLSTYTDVRFDEGRLWQYRVDGLWHEVTEDDVLAELGRWHQGQALVKGREDKPDKPFRTSASKAHSVWCLLCGFSSSPGFFSRADPGIAAGAWWYGVVGGQVVQEPRGWHHRSRHELPHSVDLHELHAYEEGLARTALGQYLDSVWGLEDPRARALQEWAGWTLLGAQASPKGRALVLVDAPAVPAGGTGKSTLIHVLESCYPRDSIVHTQPASWEDGTSLASLAGARLNTVTELDLRSLTGVESLIKSVIHGEDVSVRRIYERPFTLRPTCGHVWALNQLPRAPGASAALYERFLCLTFDRIFRGQSAERLGLSEEIVASPDVLLAWCLSGAQRVLRQGQSIPPSSREVVERWRESADPILEWIREEGIKPSTGSVHSWPLARGVYERACTWLTQSGHKTVSRRTLMERLERAGFCLARSNGVRIGVEWDEEGPF